MFMKTKQNLQYVHKKLRFASGVITNNRDPYSNNTLVNIENNFFLLHFLG